MRTWTATATADAHPAAVLDVLTDPDACGTRPTHPPVPFDAGALDQALSRLIREAALTQEG